MAAASVYPHVHVILLAQFVLALRNCFCVVYRNLAERAMEGQRWRASDGGMRLCRLSLLTLNLMRLLSEP